MPERGEGDQPSALRWPSIRTAWATIAIVVPVVVTFLTRTLAIDLAYQVRAGTVMLETHRLLDTDPFTFTYGGQPWLNQQWGAQVLFGAAFDVAGWPALVLFRGLLIGGIAAFLYFACRAQGVGSRTAALLTLGGWLIGIEILTQLRPQLFGLLLFSLCVWALTTRHAHPWHVWLVPAAVVPWANLHGSFPLAIILLVFALLEDRRNSVAVRQTFIALVLTIVASFINPFGLHAWTYIWDLSTNPVVSQQVSEWKPPTIHDWTGFFFFASVAGVAALFARRDRRVAWLPLLELGTFALLALLAGRGVAWWGLYAPVVVAGVLAGSALRNESAPDARDDRSPMSAIIIGALLLLSVVAIPARFGIDPLTGGPAFLLFAPQHLLDAARPYAPAGTRIYASQVYASWLEFAAPDLPVMTDSRIEIFPTDVWEDYFTVTNGQEGWQEVLDRWNVDVLIVHPEQSKGLLDVIDEDPGWREVSHEPAGRVFVRA